MKRLLFIIPLCLLPLLGQAQVNITFGDINYDPEKHTVSIPIENHTSEVLTLTPYALPDRHKDTYTCVVYRVKDKDGKTIYDSAKDAKPIPDIQCTGGIDDPMWYTWHTPGQLPLRNGVSMGMFNTQLLPLTPKLKEKKEAYEKHCVFSCYLDSLPENGRTLEVDLFIRLYPRPDLSVDEKDKKKIGEHAYSLPKPAQSPILYETEMHKTFELKNQQNTNSVEQ